jgi:hypothetical protein
MNGRTLFVLVTLVAAFAAVSACPSDDDDSGQDGTPSETAFQAALAIEMDDMEFTHVVGTSDCPQPIGTVIIHNATDTEATVTTALSGNGTNMVMVDPTTTTVPAGGQVTIDVAFDCNGWGGEDGFVVNLQVDVTNGMKTNSRTATITGTIDQG